MNFFKNHTKLWIGIAIAIFFGVWAMWGEWNHADFVGFLGAVAVILAAYLFDKKDGKKRKEEDERLHNAQTTVLVTHIDTTVVKRLDELQTQVQLLSKPLENDDQIIAEIGKTFIEAGKAIEGSVRAARRALNAGQYEEAEQLYDNLCVVFPNVYALHFNLAYSRVKQFKFETAVDAYSTAFKIEPHSMIAIISKGLCLGVLGRWKEAVDAYELAASITNGDYRSFVIGKTENGTPQNHMNRIPKRITDALFNDSLQSAYYFKGFSLARQNKHDQAVSVFKDSIGVGPNDARIWDAMAHSLAILNKPEEALNAVTESISSSTKKSLATEKYQQFFFRAKLLLKLRREEEAIEALDLALESKPEFIDAMFTKTLVYALMERYSDAAKTYEEASALKPDFDDATCHYAAGASYMKLGEDEKAIEAFFVAHNKAPDIISVGYNLSCAFARIKKKAEMVDWLSRAIVEDTKWKLTAQTDPDFEFYRDDPDFRRLVGLD